MAYFDLKCCSPVASRFILFVLNIFVIIIGATHLGYASQLNKVKKNSIELDSTKSNQYDALADPPTTYFIIGGGIQILVGILVIIVLFEFIGKQSRLFWFRILAVLVILSFAINFCIAVYASIMLPYYKIQLLNVSINLPDATYNMLTRISKEAVDNQRILYKYMQAEAIYTWIVAVPSIAVILISLLNQFVDETTVNEEMRISPLDSTPVGDFESKNNTMQKIRT